MKPPHTHSVRHVYDINLGDSRAAFVNSLGAALHTSGHRITTCNIILPETKPVLAKQLVVVCTSEERTQNFFQPCMNL
jgi:hypothetical protein